MSGLLPHLPSLHAIAAHPPPLFAAVPGRTFPPGPVLNATFIHSPCSTGKGPCANEVLITGWTLAALVRPCPRQADFSVRHPLLEGGTEVQDGTEPAATFRPPPCSMVPRLDCTSFSDFLFLPLPASAASHLAPWLPRGCLFSQPGNSLLTPSRRVSMGNRMQSTGQWVSVCSRAAFFVLVKALPGTCFWERSLLLLDCRSQAQTPCTIVSCLLGPREREGISQKWIVGEAFWCGGWGGALDKDGAGTGPGRCIHTENSLLSCTGRHARSRSP